MKSISLLKTIAIQVIMFSVLFITSCESLVQPGTPQPKDPDTEEPEAVNPFPDAEINSTPFNGDIFSNADIVNPGGDG